MSRSALAYLNFLTHSIHLHGIHSPFVFDLQRKCIKDKNEYADYRVMESHRKGLLADQSAIQVHDMGAGSRIFASDTRSISRMARHTGIKAKRQRLLYRLCRYLECERMLELGTSLGMGTLAMALARPKGQVTTVEACPNTAAIAEREWLDCGIEQIDLKRSTFKDFYSELKDETYDLVYIDGDHSYQGTMEAFETLMGHISEQSVMIFDDIHWSRPMEKAWEEIVRDRRVTVSIDTFGWGLVFFRKGQQKEHFYLKV